MKAILAITLIFWFLSGRAFGQTYYCTLKTGGGSIRSAPLLLAPVPAGDTVLNRYLVQTMDVRNPYTVIGINTRMLHSSKPYELVFHTEGSSIRHFFKIQLTRSTGLVVKVIDGEGRGIANYEFIETNSSAISIKHPNGWTTQVSCGPN